MSIRFVRGRSASCAVTQLVSMNLNQQAFDLCLEAHAAAEDLRIHSRQDAGGPLLMDFGIDAKGGLEAGLRLAEICLAGQAQVNLVSADRSLWQGAAVHVVTDD